jgi:hypothetical protein
MMQGSEWPIPSAPGPDEGRIETRARGIDTKAVDESVMGTCDWPMPSAPRPETGRMESIVRALPAITISIGLHVAGLWWLLRTPEPWQVTRPSQPSADAIDVYFFTPEPPPQAAAAVPDVRVDAVPFPMSQPSVVVAADEARPTAPEPVTPTAAETVDSARLFGEIAGVASDLNPIAPRAQSGSDTRLRDDNRPFLDTDMRLKPPPPTPQQIARYVGRLLVSTTAANSVTGLMGAIPGRDPGREIQGAHHNQLYLPRGCDDPDDPNLSDECMGIEKR